MKSRQGESALPHLRMEDHNERFNQWDRHAFTDTSRKFGALRRKQQKERDALPLFADQIARDQPTEDYVMLERAKKWASQQSRDRDYRAAKWREARKRLDTMPKSFQERFRFAWNCAPYPADPIYLLCFLHSVEIGKFGLNNLPFALTPTDRPGRQRDRLEVSQTGS